MAKKVMLSFPNEFLREVDSIARQEQRSRSELVREALRVYIALRQDSGYPGINPMVRRALAVQDNLARSSPGTGEDSTIDVRKWRETHK
jgi:metal-responsive CopG/Arc/MetJ family transcriptional regulator